MEKSIQDLTENLNKEQKDQPKINSLYETIANGIEEVAQMESFYQLPINAIVAIIEKVDFFNCFDQVQLLKCLIENVIKNHPNELDVFHLFGVIKLELGRLTQNDLINIIGSFSNSPLCRLLSLATSELQKLPYVDPTYELQKEIKNLQAQIQKLKAEKDKEKPKAEKDKEKPKKPFRFESDVFKAVEKGKLSSVRYHIETLGVDPFNIFNEDHVCLLDFASQSNNNEIKSYFSKFMSVKLVLIGRPSAKKSRLVAAIAYKDSDSDYRPSIGLAFYSHRITSHDKEIELQIWDTASQEKYLSLASQYCRGARVAYFCYKATKRQSFEELKSMIPQIKDKLNFETVLFLVGLDSGKNKTPIEVPKEEINSLFKQDAFTFGGSFLVNIKTREGIESLLKSTGDKLCGF